MRETAVLRLGGNIVTAAFAPRGERLLVASSNGRIGLYDRSGRQVALLPRQHGLTTAAWSPDGRLFATGRVRRRRLGLAARNGSSGANDPHAVAGHRALVRQDDAARGQRDPRSARRPRDRAREDDRLQRRRRRGRSRPDGTRLRRRHPARESRRPPRSSTRTPVASSRTCARLEAGSARSRSARTDACSRAEATTARRGSGRRAPAGSSTSFAHHGYVLAEQFSPDGRSLVTSSQDGAAYVWDVSSGQRELLLVGATGATNEAAFSPDGSEIATASADRLAPDLLQPGRPAARSTRRPPQRRDERRLRPRAERRSSPARRTAARGSGTRCHKGPSCRSRGTGSRSTRSSWAPIRSAFPAGERRSSRRPGRCFRR